MTKHQTHTTIPQHDPLQIDRNANPIKVGVNKVSVRNVNDLMPTGHDPLHFTPSLRTHHSGALTSHRPIFSKALRVFPMVPALGPRGEGKAALYVYIYIYSKKHQRLTLIPTAASTAFNSNPKQTESHS